MQNTSSPETLESPIEHPKCELCNEDVYPKNVIPTKRFAVKLGRFNLLCQDCYNLQKAELDKDKPILEQSLEAIVDSREKFFNAERTDLALITGTPFERIIKIRERNDKWKNLLFEIKVRQESAYSLIQELAKDISQSERDKLKISDIAYVPSDVTKAKAAKAPRISAEEKSLNSMMNALFGHKIKTGQMTEEDAMKQVKEYVRNAKAVTFTKMASGELKCTCQSTPGICKIHNDEEKKNR